MCFSLFCIKFCKNSDLVVYVTELSDILNRESKKFNQTSLKNKEELGMSTQEQARALMMRHHHLVMNRQQSMLSRTAAEVGLDAADACNHIHLIQGKLDTSFRASYDRSSATMS